MYNKDKKNNKGAENMSTKPVPVRLSEDQIEKLDKLVDMFQEVSPGKVKRVDIIRYAIDELYERKSAARKKTAD